MVRLLANFDTKAPAKNYATAVQDAGFDKVVFLRRHKLYLILYTIVPWSLAGVLFVRLLYSLFTTGTTISQDTLADHSIQVVLALMILYFWLIARSKYFNYLLDYTIITPTYISTYNQIGLFSRQIRTLEPNKIKTIDFKSTGIINSLFNFGDIIILLEGDELWQWEIRIDYIYHPEGIKEKIKDLTDSSYNDITPQP
jgi:type III secretory pathway component EscS